MKMKFAPIFLVKVLLCLQILCLCNGAPPKRDEQLFSPVRHTKHYTNQEREFIKNELRTLPSEYFEASDTTVWKYLANKFQEKRRSGTEGFPQDRTPSGLRKYFRSTLEHDAEFMAVLPEILRQKLSDLNRIRHAGGGLPYTYEEDKLIVDMLSSPPFDRLPLYSSKVWKDITRELHIKRIEGSPGFYADRTPGALRTHFTKVLVHDPNGRVKVPPTLIQKFLTAFNEVMRGPRASSSSQPPPQNPQSNLQVPDESEVDWSCMIQELQEAPYEVDFSRFNESASPSISSPGNLGSDLEFLEDFEEFWDFSDFEE